MEPVYKVCRTCGNEFEETTKNFFPKGIGRFSPDCINCQNAVRRQKRAANPEKFREAENTAYQNKHDHILQHRAQKRREKGIPEAHHVNPNDTRNSHQRFYDNNPGAYERDLEKRRIKKAQKRREAEIPEKSKIPTPKSKYPAYTKKWREKNPDKVAELNKVNRLRQWNARREAGKVEKPILPVEQRPARRKQKREEWNANHPGYGGEVAMRRHLQKLNGEGIDPVDYKAILQEHGYHCYICNMPINPHAIKKAPNSLSYDHVIPLKPRQGDPQGTHVYENIRPVHRVCNERKGNRPFLSLSQHAKRGTYF